MNTSIIGTGRIAYFLEKDPIRYSPCTHIGALNLLKKKKYPVYFQSFCDLDIEKTQIITKELQLESKTILTDNYKEAIDLNPDLVVIATNTNSHYLITEYALKKNVKKIILEKPVAMNKKEAENILKLATIKKAKIWINYERRYHPKYLKLKKIIIESEPWGRALYYNGTFCSNSKSMLSQKENEGILLHDTTHLLDLVYFLFGRENSKYLVYNKKKNVHNILLQHKEISGNIISLGQVPYFHFELEIFFEHARIHIGNGFFYIEKKIRNKFYSNFNSLTTIKNIRGKKIKWNDNPFIRLYLNVLNDNYDIETLKDACQNITTMTTDNKII